MTKLEKLRDEVRRVEIRAEEINDRLKDARERLKKAEEEAIITEVIKRGIKPEELSEILKSGDVPILEKYEEEFTADVHEKDTADFNHDDTDNEVITEDKEDYEK